MNQTFFDITACVVKENYTVFECFQPLYNSLMNMHRQTNKTMSTTKPSTTVAMQ